MSEDNGMKQYLAVETLWDDDLNQGQYEVVFSAHNVQNAEDHVASLNRADVGSYELCGELTDTYIVR